MCRRATECQLPLHDLIGRSVVAAILTILFMTGIRAQPTSLSAAEAAALARRTAAERLTIPIERLQVTATTPAEWRDSSLGCPERGMVYTPALTSGYKVTLRDGHRVHTVHVGAGTAVVCGSRTDPKLSSRVVHGPALTASAAVRSALAARLRVSPSRVRIVSARPAASRTCAAAPPTAAGAAFIVDAVVGSHRYRYYADEQTVTSCEASSRDGDPRKG
jgi:hypothetical protein